VANRIRMSVVMTSRRQQSHTNLVVLHSSGGVDENDIKILFPCFEIITGEQRLHHKGDSALTIVDRFSSDTCGIFAISPLEQLYLAIGRSINSKHAQVSHMHAKLFNGSTPGESGVIFQTKDHSIWYRPTHRKVSHAAIKTRSPFCSSQKQTLDKLVLFPTPLTPTKVMLYGVLR